MACRLGKGCRWLRGTANRVAARPVGDKTMIRKLLGGVLLLGVGSYLLLGTSMGSYARTAYTQVVGYWKGQVPIEFEVERARQLIADLVPEIHRTTQDIAVEEVRLARLKGEIAKTETNLKDEQVGILALRDQLKEPKTVYTIGNRKFTAEQLERDLARRFRSFQRASQTLDSRKELVVVRETKLDAAKSTYKELVETKKELEAEIESLDAQQKMLEAQKVAQRIVVDQGRFDDARKALDEIRERIAVDQKMLEDHGVLSEPVPVEEIPPVDLTDQIDKFFSTSGESST